jgi:hypothetical protein
VRFDLGENRRVLRISGSRTEQIQQWTAAKPGALYLAEVDARAKVSPGTACFLILSFLDEQQQHVGPVRVDRVPADPQPQDLRLGVIARAPANARWVGVAIRVLNQINNDFVEFSGASLRVKPD